LTIKTVALPASGEKEEGELLLGVLKHAPKTTPGTAFEYSNGGYAIAGHMAEVKTGVAWEELMQRRVFEPLGITSAGFGASGKADVVDQPRGHTGVGIAIVPGPLADNPCAIGPAGTVHMTVPDWSKFVAMHLAGTRDENGDAAKDDPRLTGASFRVLHTPFAKRDGRTPGKDEAGAAYACGWGELERPWAGGRVLTHSGSNTMWFCTVWIAPEKNIAVMAACNQGGDVGAKATDQAVGMLIQEMAKSPNGQIAK
jgi:CubicO group peptidase (beta-lactamase class C family)